MSREVIYEQTGVAMTCRAFGEYKEMFMLDEALLRKGPVLDVASGASSFTAELMKRGYDGQAVDPLYKLSLEEMSKHGEAELKLAAQKIRKNAHLFTWDTYETLEKHEKIREQSLCQFLASYKENRQLYKEAKLPSLPFNDHTFSLVLCNHFLFLYQDQFDYDFHLQAIEELVRVTKKGGVIRIYPLVGFKNELYSQMDELIEVLRDKGFTASLEKTDFRFMPDAAHYLNIIK
ncbi:methyltransferase domain-containing protein [Metabacillus fastidiosus]|uniref:class I SAM-dependent methyltransferase n=1 Tax=Metabacillus fastidiosus TaxID=1458 RepID=UPI003D277A44